ncbi:MAG: hypothetical protein ACXVYY_01350 [Oryzihumus sp.]
MSVSRTGTSTQTSSTAGTATSVTVTLASNTVGALNVVAVNTQPSTGSAVTMSTPTGWTLVDTITDAANTCTAVYARAYQTGDGTTATFSWTGNTASYGAVCVAYTGQDSTAPTGTPVHQSMSASSTVAPLSSLTTTSAGGMAVAVLGLGSNSTTTTAEPTGYSKNIAAAGKLCQIDDQVFVTPTTTGALTWTLSASARGSSIHFEVMAGIVPGSWTYGYSVQIG